MFTIRRFASLAEIKPIWQELEQQGFYYPFQTFAYSSLFTKHFSKESDLLLLEIEEDGLTTAVTAFEQSNDRVLWLGMKSVLGKEEITDYGDLLFKSNTNPKAMQDIWQTLFFYLKNLGIRTVQLDYLRSDSQNLQFLENKASEWIIQETSPYINLPNSWEDYLDTLTRIDRKELKRKFKRLANQKPEYELCQTITSSDMVDFIKLHRLSDPAKAKFMSAPMARFFQDLVKEPLGMWQAQLQFLKINQQRVAAVLAFVNSSHMLLYNSGYDPNFAYYSVGLLLKAKLIQIAIENKLQVFDFLRGNERYKYDLGARDLTLKQLRINL